MTAEAPVLDMVEIDLDSLTLEELVEEKGRAKAEIAKIAAQLMDHTRRPSEPEDDGPAWVAFRDWRRRARWARVHLVREHGEIKSLLAVRNHERAVAAQRRRESVSVLPPDPNAVTHTPEEYEQLRASAVERRAELLSSLNSGGADAIALRLYRALRHLIGDGDGLPPELDCQDIEALKDASIFLRAKYTTSGVKNFVKASAP